MFGLIIIAIIIVALIILIGQFIHGSSQSLLVESPRSYILSSRRFTPNKLLNKGKFPRPQDVTPKYNVVLDNDFHCISCGAPLNPNKDKCDYCASYFQVGSVPSYARRVVSSRTHKRRTNIFA